jgi:hypothetical protein
MSAIHSHPGCFVSRPGHGNRMNHLFSTAWLFSLFIFSFVNPSPTFAQEPRPSNPATLHAGMKENLNTLVATPGISGYENELAEKIRVEISALHPKTDNLGDVIVTNRDSSSVELPTKATCEFNGFLNPACLRCSTNSTRPSR